MTRHQLLDGQAMNQSQPAPFRIPSASDKSRIRPGDHVKVGFVDDLGIQEFVWVLVHAINGTAIDAVLDDDPIYADMCFGEHIDELRHVLGIEHSSSYERQEEPVNM
jgi:hypothetical protein